MNITVKWWLLWVFSSLAIFLLIADLNAPVRVVQVVLAVIIAYAVTTFFYNLDGFFRHQLRKITSSNYRKYTQKRGNSSRNRFLVFPFHAKETKWQ